MALSKAQRAQIEIKNIAGGTKKRATREGRLVMEGDSKATGISELTGMEPVWMESPSLYSSMPARMTQWNLSISECVTLRWARTILVELNMMCKMQNVKAPWPEALKGVVHIHNRSLTWSAHRDLRDKTPNEIKMLYQQLRQLCQRRNKEV